MRITSVRFMKGITGTNDILENDIPQIAVIGRSNVGKSSLINSLTGQKGLAKTSSFPGYTREINVYLINHSTYLLDLPGYGYAKASRDVHEHYEKMIHWYLFRSGYPQKKVVLIIDANVGPSYDDLDILHMMEEAGKDIVIVANKIDKIKPALREARLAELRTLTGNHTLIAYSSDKKIGIDTLTREIL